MEASIKAMDDTYGHQQSLAVLVPSYPTSGRICVGGYQIVHGIPLERSPIAKDAATPVNNTSVLKIVAEQSAIACGFVPLDRILAGPAAVRETIEDARAVAVAPWSAMPWRMKTSPPSLRPLPVRPIP